MEDQLEQINARVSRATERMNIFTCLDGLIADKERVDVLQQKTQLKMNEIAEKKRLLENKLKSLNDEKVTIQNAGTFKRAFLRSLDAVEKTLHQTASLCSPRSESLLIMGSFSRIQKHAAVRSVAEFHWKIQRLQGSSASK